MDDTSNLLMEPLSEVLVPSPELLASMYPYKLREVIPADCLVVATIVGEAGGEPYRGKVAVAKTIRNRMRLKFLSDGTVAGTVLAALQFSMWNAHDPNRVRVCNLPATHPVVDEAWRAWLHSEKHWPGFEDVVLYHAEERILKQLHLSVPSWAKVHKLAGRVGRQLFYRIERR